LTKVSLSPEQINEIVRCYHDPVYFIETFGWLEEKETRRILQFNPFPYQRVMLEWMRDGFSILVLKDRRVGCSWITAAYAAWLLNFHRGVNCLFLSKREDDAKKLLKKVKFVLKNLAYHDSQNIATATKAPWLRNEFGTDNQQLFSIIFRDDTGEVVSESEASSLTTTSESGRSEGASLIFLDEFAFVAPDDEATWAAIKPTVMRGGQWVMVSTPDMVGSVFHRLCMEALRGENRSYKFLEVNYFEAGITDEQVEAAIEGMDADRASREFGHQFIQGGSPAFRATDLAACYKPPDEYPEVAQALAEYRQKVGIYYSGVDNAEGKAHRKSREKDYHSWISLTKTGIQAFAYHSKEPISSWAGQQTTRNDGTTILIPGQTTKLHANWRGLVKIEENGAGLAVLNRHVIPNDGESMVWASHTDAPTKTRLIQRLKIAIESHDIIITDLFTYQCLLVYQHGTMPGQYEAPQGYNDDPVIALALANDLRFEYGNLEFTWAAEPQRRSLSEAEMAEVDISQAPLAPDVLPMENLRQADLLPGPGAMELLEIGIPLPDLALVEDGEPELSKNGRRKDMR